MNKEETLKSMEKMMNPIPEKDFSPNDFDMMKDVPEYKYLKRKRVLPSKELPTFGLKPKVIREGQMIGEYESKQDLYLTFAHRCNKLQKKVEELEERLKKLENK